MRPWVQYGSSMSASGVPYAPIGVARPPTAMRPGGSVFAVSRKALVLGPRLRGEVRGACRSRSRCSCTSPSTGRKPRGLLDDARGMTVAPITAQHRDRDHPHGVARHATTLDRRVRRSGPIGTSSSWGSGRRRPSPSAGSGRARSRPPWTTHATPSGGEPHQLRDAQRREQEQHQVPEREQPQVPRRRLAQEIAQALPVAEDQARRHRDRGDGRASTRRRYQIPAPIATAASG